MESREIRDLIESYYSVYNESIVRGNPSPNPSLNSRSSNGSSSGSSGGSGGILDRVVDTVTKVAKPPIESQARKKYGPLGGPVAGREVDEIGNQVKRGDYGGALDRAVKGAGKLFNSVDMFDIVKGHLLDEGYADTEQAALAIMANMSEQWKQSIVEDIRGLPYKPNPIGDAIKTGAGMLGSVIKTGANPQPKKPQPTIKKGPPMRDEPLF